MKIGKSTIHFNTTINYDYDYKSIADCPYWACYSVNRKTKKTTYIDTLTYKEVVDFLKEYPYHITIHAYPRKSLNRRRAYTYECRGNEYFVIDKHTGEVYLQYEWITDTVIYQSPEHDNLDKLLKNLKERIHNALWTD